jgi:hypothetical protein
MFKFSLHENGKLESFEITWQFVVGLVSGIAAIASGLFTVIAKAFLILVIGIQGLFADPDSFYNKQLV